MSFRSPFPDVDIPDVSIHDFLFGQIDQADLEKSALVDGKTGDSTTYRELIERIDAVAGALAARGAGTGDVVAVLSPNSPQFAVAFHGAIRAGATVTTINALYTSDEIASQLRDSDAQFLFTAAALLPQATAAADKVQMDPSKVIVLDDAHAWFGSTLTALLDEQQTPPAIAIDPRHHIAVLPYSSGTTGRPKGVMLTHHNLVANLCQIAPLGGFNRDDTFLAVLPFFHIYGLTVLLNSALHSRATLVTMTKFELDEMLRVVSDHRCTYLFIAPPVALAIAKHPHDSELDLSSIRMVISGAAPLDANLARIVADRLGCPVRQGYGMSELSPVSHAIPAGEAGDSVGLGSVGFPVPNTENKLVDPVSGAEISQPAAGTSKPGELWVRGPNVMAGYRGRADETAATIDAEGYLHTGDLATVDALGIVTITDRLKELIKYKGYQVPPAELEAVLLQHPDIADAAVVGALDHDGEEVPKAYIVLVGGAHVTPSEVIDFVAVRVAPHKKVRQVEFISAVPKSAAGKILRNQLRTPA
ncbi:AMP-binding protein [Nocardia neocaledoniensis]|uniref:AMP-binding protein n=1 Tax=Nocardia neocaledoniensis TaxID=236511 RepID=UPI0033FAA9FE